MTQRDYLLRMITEASRVIAQVIYRKQLKDYQGAIQLIDEQFKQTLGMGEGFIRSAPEETLLSLLSTPGELNIEKCWLVAMLLKAEGDIFREQGNQNESYYCNLKACNLFLEALFSQNALKQIAPIPEIEELLVFLDEYELPQRTKRRIFAYFEVTGRYGQAEDILFDALETRPEPELIEEGQAFYQRLLKKNEGQLRAGNFSRAEVQEGLEKLREFRP